jgi:tetratricopeptide (TPR) repeat protein
MGKKLGNGFSLTHQLVGGISDHDLGNTRHNYDECVKLLSEIIAKQPRNTDAFNNRGLAYADLKQFKKAIQDYNQAIELDPEYTRPLKALKSFGFNSMAWL